MGDWKVWVKGVSAAVIGGAASALVAALGAPETMPGGHGTGWSLLRMSAVGATLSAAAYLKKSPLPTAATEEQR